MARTIRTIRRSIHAALTAGHALVTAARGHHHRLLVALYRAIDTQATVRIAYRAQDGAETVRDIQPHTLQPTADGHITCTAHDLLRGERRTFRTDRITAATVQLAA